MTLQESLDSHDVKRHCIFYITLSDNNIGQWLPFPPYPLPNVVLQVQKKNRKKSRHHCSNIERGEAGEVFLLRVARDFWLGCQISNGHSLL